MAATPSPSGATGASSSSSIRARPRLSLRRCCGASTPCARRRRRRPMVGDFTGTGRRRRMTGTGSCSPSGRTSPARGCRGGGPCSPPIPISTVSSVMVSASCRPALRHAQPQSCAAQRHAQPQRARLRRRHDHRGRLRLGLLDPRRLRLRGRRLHLLGGVVSGARRPRHAHPGASSTSRRQASTSTDFDERHRTYELRIGIEHMAYCAFAGMDDDLAAITKQTEALL